MFPEVMRPGFGWSWRLTDPSRVTGIQVGSCFHLGSRGSLSLPPSRCPRCLSGQGLLSAVLWRGILYRVEGCPQDFIVPGIRTLTSPAGIPSVHIDKDSSGSFWEMGCLPREEWPSCNHCQSTLWKISQG